MLKKQQEEVVKPLIQELKIADELRSRQKKQFEQNKKDIQMAYSILKFPAMCEQYQKALKRKLTTKKFKQLEQDSIHLLRQHINEDNQEEFFDEFSSRLASDPFSNNFLREPDQSRLVNFELHSENSGSPAPPRGSSG